MSVVIFCASISTNVCAEMKNETEVSQVICMEDVYDLSEDELDNLNVIEIDRKIKSYQRDDVEELMDNGTEIMVKNNSYEDIQNYFSLDETQESGDAVAFYLSKNGDDVKVAPVECKLLTESDKVKKGDKKELIEELKQNDGIGADEVYWDKKEQEENFYIPKKDINDVARLQGGVTIGDSFADNSKFVYFYKKGIAGGVGTTYKYSSADSIKGYSKLGSIRLTLYVVSTATASKNNDTYDNVYSITSFGALNGKFVEEIRNGISITNENDNAILDYTDVDGKDDTKVTTKIGTNYDVSKNKIGKETTVTYNPNGTHITVTQYKNRIRWTAEPTSDKKNHTYKINPGMMVKTKNGKTKSITVKTYISYFQLSGGIRTYTEDDTVSCGITYKNHAKQ